MCSFRFSLRVYILSGVHEDVMRSRFEYEAPGLLKKAALTLKAPHKWRSRVRPWVFDKKSGVRFQLDADEHAVLKPLTSRIKNGGERRATDARDAKLGHVEKSTTRIERERDGMPLERDGRNEILIAALSMSISPSAVRLLNGSRGRVISTLQRGPRYLTRPSPCRT